MYPEISAKLPDVEEIISTLFITFSATGSSESVLGIQREFTL